MNDNNGKTPDSNWLKARAIALSSKVKLESSWLFGDRGYDALTGGGLEAMRVDFGGLHKDAQAEIRNDLKNAGILAPTIPTLNQMAAAYIVGNKKTAEGLGGEEIRRQAIINATPDKTQAALHLGMVKKEELRQAVDALSAKGINLDRALDLVLAQKRGDEDTVMQILGVKP